MEGYIFTLRNEGVPFYVGQSIMDPVRRRNAFMAQAMHPHYNSRPVYKKILELGKENVDFEVEKFAIPKECLDEEVRKHIIKFDTLYPNGCNVSSGGTSGYEVSKERRNELFKRRNMLKVASLPPDKRFRILSEEHKQVIIRKQRDKALREGYITEPGSINHRKSLYFAGYVKKLVDMGMKFREVGEVFGISRQLVYHYYTGSVTGKGKAKFVGYKVSPQKNNSKYGFKLKEAALKMAQQGYKYNHIRDVLGIDAADATIAYWFIKD